MSLAMSYRRVQEMNIRSFQTRNRSVDLLVEVLLRHSLGGTATRCQLVAASIDVNLIAASIHDEYDFGVS